MDAKEDAVRVSLRIDPALKTELRSLAQQSNRSLNGLIEHVLSEHVAIKTQEPHRWHGGGM